MKTTIKMTLCLVVLAFAASSFASITCHTPRLSKAFKIENQTIAFYQNDVAQGRKLASKTSVTTRKNKNGFTKTMKFEGQNYIIHIEDKSNLSDFNDYLVIKSKEGHEMTYPLTCN